MTPPPPGRVLRLAVIAWGLGDLAMGRRRAALAWLGAEAALLALIAFATLTLADTTWYLLPYLLGMTFLATWVFQAVLVYRMAQRADGAIAPAARGSAALTIAWLALPLLLWGTGFWLLAAGSASPAGVVDRFVTDWSRAARGEAVRPLFSGMAADPAALRGGAVAALERLGDLCERDELLEDCDPRDDNLLRDVRVRIVPRADGSATAVAELVRYVRRPSTFLGVFRASELVPIPVEELLRLELRRQPAMLGAERWTIVNVERR